MDLSNFYRNDHSDEYEVTVEVRATVTETVKAASAEEARQIIEGRIKDNNLEVYGQDIDRAEVSDIRRPATMYLIHRPGTNVSGTTNPQPGDEPRDPKPYETAWRPDTA